jgi:hypothetical protein
MGWRISVKALGKQSAQGLARVDAEGGDEKVCHQVNVDRPAVASSLSEGYLYIEELLFQVLL